jgi:hypothetical protein
MVLPPADVELYYKLMWGAQFYINQKTGTLKNVATADQYNHLSSEKKVKVRDLMWQRPSLIDDYIQANPDALSDEELEILRRWRSQFLKGTFYVFRHLKKGTIFIGDKDKVYSVTGLMTPLDELVPGYALPQVVMTVLLPFKGMIIYDGLFSGYNVIIGSHMRADLNHVYQVAKQKERIIFSLDTVSKPITKLAHPHASTWIPKVADLTSQLAAIKGDTAVQNAALSLARASLDLALAAGHEEHMDQHRRKIRRASTRLENLMEIDEEE